MEFIAFIKDHFLHAAPLLACGAFALAIMIERSYSLYLRYPMRNMERFFNDLSSHVMKANIAEAARLCDRHKRKPAANVVKAALQRAHLPEGLIRDGIQLSLQNCSRAILKRTSYLATIANVATLLGLFGTVAGLIQSFQAVAHADAQQKSALLSAGIATAMNATMLGLGIAIPCMIVFSLLTNRTNNLISDLEQAAVRTMDILKQRFYSSEFIKSPLAKGDSNGDSDSMGRAA
jgi:biopolymer transport protein ExbB